MWSLHKALVKSSSFRPANLLCYKRPITPLLLLWIGAEDWFIVKSLLKRDCLVVGCLCNSWTFCVSTKEIIESLRNHWGRKSLCSMGRKSLSLMWRKYGMNQLAHTCLHIFKLIVCEILNISRYIEKVLTEVLLRSMQTA